MKGTLDSTGSNEDGKFKRGEEDYEHFLIDLKAMGLGFTYKNNFFVLKK